MQLQTDTLFLSQSPYLLSLELPRQAIKTLDALRYILSLLNTPTLTSSAVPPSGHLFMCFSLPFCVPCLLSYVVFSKVIQFNWFFLMLTVILYSNVASTLLLLFFFTPHIMLDFLIRF